MSLIGSNILVGASGNQGGYQISRSVRLRASASGYFNRTLSAGASQQKWTWSSWFKLGDPASGNILFQQYTDGSNQSQMRFGGGQTRFYDLQGAAFVCDITWTPVHRDPSAWYHVVFAIDTTQATNTNRIKFYVNGVQVTVTASAAWPAQNSNMRFNGNTPHFMNTNGAGSGFGDGYRTEINFVNNQQLDPTSFGETNAITGVWQPKKYAGTYGTNGFYLNFSDNSAATAAAIGKDSSGNGNNWTPNNISVTAGVTYDSMIDTPTPYADGNSGRGNYATWNPLAMGSDVRLAAGNLDASWVNINGHSVLATIALPKTGKWKCELTGAYQVNFGISPIATQKVTEGIGTTVGYGYRGTDGQKIINGTTSAYGATYNTTDVITLLFDADALTLQFNKNNVSQGVIAVASNEYVVGIGYQTTSTGVGRINFGQRPFQYVDTGFLALNTQNLPASTIENGGLYFNAKPYIGNNDALQSITGIQFQPDLIWIKDRSSVGTHVIVDSVRGRDKHLASNLTNAEATDGATAGVTSFNADGFSVQGDPASYGSVNDLTDSYISWQWKAGGAAVTNTAGSISSQVSANTSAGFSVVTYTGTGAAATVGHGLGVAPAMMIFKPRNAADNWPVWHKSFAVNEYVYLNLTVAKASLSTFMNSTLPNSSIITLGSWANTNANANTMVAYCFAEVAGYSKFGSYTGNGSANGVFVYLGFRPRFVMIKRTDTTGNWGVWDTARDTFNATKYELVPNLSDAETSAAGDRMDILSNGFKLRNTGIAYNANAGTYIYACFAENPFSKALAR